nr:integrase, catalytic region, zinc finger, CCHC-type, peptidase aspartic, catalytic [Tanacetum cinerariifolium]
MLQIEILHDVVGTSGYHCGVLQSFSVERIKQETSSKILPYGDGSCWKMFKPIDSLIAKGVGLDPRTKVRGMSIRFAPTGWCRIKETSNALHNAIMEAGGKDRPPMLAPDKDVPVTEGSSETTTKRYMENYKNVSQDIHNQLNAEAEAVQIILTGIDNDFYSTIDACPNACEMCKAIERLKQGESINVYDFETNLYWEFRKFTSRDGESLELYYSRFYKMMNELVWNQCDVTNHQHQNEVNEIRAQRLARTANPLALVTQQQPVYHHQNRPTHYTQNSSTSSQQAATRNIGKAIINFPPPIYDQEPIMVAEDDEMSKDKEIDKLMALISLSFKKIYKHTNNNLRTSSNTSRANQDNSPRINRGTGYDNQRICNVAGPRENVGTPVARDATYHKEKMLLCKQEEAGFQLNAEQADWRDDTDEEPKDQELEAHYMYMTQIQEVTPDVADNSGPIFDTEPLQKDDDDDLANERDLLASLIEKLKSKIDDSKNRNKFLETSNKALVDKLKSEIENFKTKNKSLESSNNHFKEANNELSKTNELMYKNIKKFQVEFDRYNDVQYASKLVEIILFIVNSGCSKHMTGNLKLLTNFVEKFLGTVKFRNDQIAPILGFGDLVQGIVTIKRVYYVEGLNHNLFSVGQFCDADLEVTFWKSTCYIRDLKRNDLLTGSRGTNLYSITLQDTSSPNLICLMAKATSSLEDPPEVPMADNRTMTQLLQEPTMGYEDAIVVPEIAATNFELKYGLINLVQNKQFFGHDKEDPHAHICYFNKITSTMRVPNVPNSTIKLMLFPFSLEGAARIWLEKEPPRSILTWDDLVSKFIN